MRGKSITGHKLPDLGFEDEELKTIKDKLDLIKDELNFEDNIRARLNWIELSHELTDYMFINIHTDPDFGDEIINILYEVFDWLENNYKSKYFRRSILKTVKSYHETLRVYKNKGSG